MKPKIADLMKLRKHIKDSEGQRIRGRMERDLQNAEVFKPLISASTEATEKQVKAIQEQSSEQQRKLLELTQAVGEQTEVAKKQLEQRQKIMVVKDSHVPALPSKSVIQPAEFIIHALNERDKPESGLELKSIPNTARFKLGYHEFIFNRDEMKNVTNGDVIKGVTKGLMTLLTKKNLTKKLYSEEDEDIYLNLIVKSQAYLKDPSDPSSGPISSQSWKWKNIVGTWYENRGNRAGYGIGKIDIPEDDTELVKRLEIALGEMRGGNCNSAKYAKLYADEARRRSIISNLKYRRILEYLLDLFL